MRALHKCVSVRGHAQLHAWHTHVEEGAACPSRADSVEEMPCLGTVCLLNWNRVSSLIVTYLPQLPVRLVMRVGR